MTKELLIVGIDPGITTAYAVLDANGSLIKLKSSKRFTLSAVINEIIGIDGKVVAVGSDVKYPPQYIQKFSAAFNARLLSPKEDMKVGVKERVTSSIKTNDDHQRDALAAALFAWSEVRPLFQKVDAHLKQEGKEHLTNEVKMLTIKGVGIADALERLENKQTPSLQRKRVRQKIRRSRKIFDENILLKEQNERLMRQINFLREKIEKLERTIRTALDAKVSDALKLKEKKISSLHQSVNDCKRAIESLKKEKDLLVAALLDMRGKAVVKRFKNLGKEIIAHLEPNEVIYIDDPGSISEATLEYLKETNTKVIAKNRPSQNLLNKIVVIDAKSLNIKEYDKFIIINEDEVRKELESRDILSKVVAEYRESRA